MKVSEPYTIFPRTLSSGKVVYYYQFRLENGQRSSAKSTGCTTLGSAKRYCNKLYNQGEFKQSSKLKFSVYAKDFFTKESNWYKWKSVNNTTLTDETLLAYNKWLNNQVLPFFENYQLTAITRATVKEWIIWASSKWSPKTVNNGQTVLNIILNSAVDQELIEYNPANNLGFRKCEKIKRDVWTTNEIKQIYESHWCYYVLRTAFLLGAITGMRISEIAGLKKENIHDDYILVETTYSRKFGLGETTKGKVSRIVPIPQDFPFPSIESEWVFPMCTKPYKPFDITRMNEQINTICKHLGINCKERKLTTHVLRDFYNTYLESENVSDAKIKAVIGHKDPSMTGHYTYWKPDMFPEVHIAQDKLYKAIRG